jgi:hypothetical protein
MNEEPQGGGLVRRVTQLAATLPATPMELVERIRAIRAEAHVLSPAVTAASIPPHIRINTVVEVIDPTFDPKTGRGNDVYFQASIHKSQKRNEGGEDVYVPLEVSLNATAIKRVLAAAGVSVTHSEQIPTAEPNHWKWQSRGKMRDFDGGWREVPPGTSEIDFRDGSAQIGEWTPDKWAKAEVDAEERKKTTAKNLQWKCKANIGGWTADRVMASRRFGLRLAEAKSLNALGRNFGLKQVYTLEELKKPFVIFRATFSPDMADPEIKRMVTAAEFGATNLLYPQGGAVAPALPPAQAEPAHAESSAVDGEVVSEQHQQPSETTAPDEDVPFTPAADADPVYHVTQVMRRKGGGFYVMTRETGDKHLLTDEERIATVAHAAIDKEPISIDIEGRGGESWILQIAPAKKDSGF